MITHIVTIHYVLEANSMVFELKDVALGPDALPAVLRSIADECDHREDS